MIGYISSVHVQKRYGFVKEKGSNTTYFFGFRSILDKELKPKVGVVVSFELYKKNEKESVAVSIRRAQAPNKSTSSDASEYINAVVSWFSDEKRYGYVTCENSEDAFLHVNCLQKAGVSTVKPKQRIKVKLVENKYPGKKAVSDVILLNNSRRYPEMLHPREPKYDKSNQRCSANDLAEIPESLVNHEKRRDGPNFVNALANNSFPFPRMPHPGQQSPGLPKENFFPTPNSFYGPPYHSHYGEDVYERPNAFDQQYRMRYEEPPRMPVPFNAYPNSPSPYVGPRPYEAGFYNAPPRTPNSSSGAVRMPCPSTPGQNCQQDSYPPNMRTQPGFKTYRNSPSQKLPITNPEYAKIKQQIHQKENLLKSLNLTKLPDAGQRLRDQIKDLKHKMKNLSMHDKEIVTEVAYPQTSKEKPRKKVPLVDALPIKYDTSVYAKYNHERKKQEEIVHKVTVDAIEKLHSSLNTCPCATAEFSDPAGLKVTLMVHQRQALAWMVWREKQIVSGGILADDMGLGKTLTMIALVLLQFPPADSLLKSNKNDDEIVTSEKGDAIEEKGSETETKTEDNNETENDDQKENSSEAQPDSFDGISCNSTLIVAPAALIYHWENEIRNRCDKGLLSIHLFHGSDREKDAEKLSEFDVVITTYAIVMRTDPSKKSDKKDEKTEAKKGEKPEGKKDKKPEAKKDETPEANADTKSEASNGAGEDALFRIRWKRIILDEAHQIRNYKSRTSEAVCSLHAQSRWALSGTPIQNDENDMYAMLKFLHCKPFDEHKLWKQQVCNKTKVGQERLKTLVSCFVLRREKSQKGTDGKPLVLLPPRSFTTHTLKLSDIEQEVYRKLKEESCSAFQKYQSMKEKKIIPRDRYAYSRHYSSSKEKMSATNLLVKLLRLRQCCNHLHLLKNSFDTELLESERQQVAVEDLFESLALRDDIIENKSLKVDKYLDKDKSVHFDISATSSKVKFVMDSLHKLNFEKPNEKSVVVSQWTSMLRIIAHHLEQAKLSYAIIEGGVTARKRMSLVDDFNRNPVKPKIMLVSLQAGGVGLNLIGGNHLFLLDMHWNPALEKQAFDRIYRVGQTKEVFVHKLVLQGTVDEQILQLQEQKLSVADSVMAGADTENKVKLTLSDMKMLFGL